MKIKTIASLFVCAVLLVTVAPARAFAQTLSHPAIAPAEQTSDGARAERKPDLKARFTEVIANAKADTLSAEGIKRLDREKLPPQSTVKSGFSNKNVVLAVVVVVVIVGLAIVLAHNGVDPNVSCDVDPLAPNCVR